ncbi:MAG: GAF domain-containing protein [Chloroflexi bacterium CFX4]|nr:GAF domain-containing protein [Chloroflexi bacterium CFX4]MDL1924035.1 GAF domain-containing protein [Chloroflexi bacterium CFX3]
MRALQPKQPLSIWQSLRFRNWRIIVRITVLLLGVSLLTALTVTVFITQSAAQSLTQQMRQRLDSMAFGSARVLQDDDEFTLKSIIALQAQSLDEFLNQDASDYADALLETIYNTYPAIQDIYITDADGIIIAALDERRVGEQPNTPHIQRALQGELSTTKPYLTADSTFTHALAAIPLKYQADILGVLVFNYRLNIFDFLLRDTLLIQQGEGSVRTLRDARLYAVNEEGLVLFDSDKDRAWLHSVLGAPSEAVAAKYSAEGALGMICTAENWDGSQDCPPDQLTPRTTFQTLPAMQPILDLTRQVFAKPERGSFRYCRPDDLNKAPATDECNGTWYLVGYAPMQNKLTGETWFVVIAEVPESAVLEAVTEQRVSGFTIAAFVLPLAFLVAVLMARTIARPIRRLSAVAAEVERGQPLNEPIIAHVARRGDELGDLSRIFGNMVRALNARREELQTIYNIGTTISGSLDLNETLNYVVTSLRQVIPYDWAEISFYDAHRQQIIAQVAADHDSVEPADPQPINAMQGYLSYLLTQGSGVCVADIATFKGAVWQSGRQWDRLQPRAYLGVPLKAKDKIIGVIEMISGRVNGLSTDHLRVLESVAVQAAVALQNAQEVQVREAKLRQEIQELRIEIDEAKKTKQVAAITESEYFQHLQSRISDLRKRTKKPTDESDSARPTDATAAEKSETDGT